MVSFRILVRLARAREVREFQSRENTSRIFFTINEKYFRRSRASGRKRQKVGELAAAVSRWKAAGESSGIERAELQQMRSSPGVPVKHILWIRKATASVGSEIHHRGVAGGEFALHAAHAGIA